MKKILLVEDNEDIRNNTAEILELSNYTVYTAENGKVGVEKAIEHNPDLIICDIMMPELDGYGVLHAVQKHDKIKNTPFIFLTAKTERSDFRKGMDLGADDYITKPFDGTELLNAVDRRIQKIALLKKELSPGLDGFNNLMQSSLEKDALKNLSLNRHIDKFKKKYTIYAEGNHPSKLFYIIRGKVKTYKTNDDGKKLVTELYGEGDFLGHIALLDGSVYQDSAETLEDTEIAIIPRDEFDNLVNKNREVSKKLIQLLAKNISSKENQLISLAYNSLRKKVADAIVMLHNKYKQENDREVIIDISRESLATIAGTATESLIRTLSDFKTENLIDIKDGCINILNIKKLENLVN